MWTLLLIPAVLAGMGALLWLTDALDCGLSRRRVRASIQAATPEEAEEVVAQHGDVLLRRSN
jgi:hypothetical protein